MTKFQYELQYQLPYFKCNIAFFNFSRTNLYKTNFEIKISDVLSFPIIDGKEVILEVEKIRRILTRENYERNKDFRDLEGCILFLARCDCLSMSQRERRITSKQMMGLLELYDIEDLQSLLGCDFPIDERLLEKVLDDMESTLDLPFSKAEKLTKGKLLSIIYDMLSEEITNFEILREKDNF